MRLFLCAGFFLVLCNLLIPSRSVMIKSLSPTARTFEGDGFQSNSPPAFSLQQDGDFVLIANGRLLFRQRADCLLQPVS